MPNDLASKTCLCAIFNWQIKFSPKIGFFSRIHSPNLSDDPNLRAEDAAFSKSDGQLLACLCLFKSRVVSKNIFLIASEEENGRHVTSQGVNPGHVQSSRADAFSWHWQSHHNQLGIL